MIDTALFYDALVRLDVDMFAGVPDSLLKDFCAYVTANAPHGHNIITANEGNAVAIAAGYHVATGKFAAVYMQNSGEGNAVNPLLSLTDSEVYNIPLLLIIGWRGEPGVKDEPQHVTQGRLTLPILETLGIRYLVADDGYATQLDYCVNYMRETGRPIALVIKKGSFSPCSLEKPQPRFGLSRESALEAMLPGLDGAFTVTTTGKTSRELFELRECRKEGHSRDFLTVGSMGHTASIALGMALGCDKTVFCIDGDGSFLMHLGSLAVAARHAPDNFKYVLINNGAHESVGGQPTVALEIDAPGVLSSFGFEHVVEARTVGQVSEGIALIKKTPRAAMIVYVDQGSRADLGRPTVSPRDNKLAMMREFGVK